ncbi:MAG: branched-chain amino acid ABC transporter permease [Hyphomicrobiales bacterium]|nr:branched-chain amino acid ABC transporter permease [Hyphomicrobiales bacterium]
MLQTKTLVSIVLLVLPVLVLVGMTDAIDVRLVTRIATTLCINLVLVLGLQVFMGNSGILSFVHIAFMGIGAYTSGVLSMPLQMKSMALPNLYPVIVAIEVSPYAGMLIGGIAAALVAAVVSYPLMRLTDAAAVITSFALLMVLHTVMVHWNAVTNGPRTLFGVQNATTLPLAAAVAVVMIVVAMAFKESRAGILLRAVRDDEVAAGAIGADVARLRWQGFVLSAFMAGVGGGVWAHFITSYSPAAFYLKETFVILGMLVIGGAATVSGAVFGTFAVTAAFEGLRAAENAINIAGVLPTTLVGLTEIVLALAMIATLILRPGGIVGDREVGALPLLRKSLRIR